ncbi:ulp1 protease family protein [Colletotrichum tofieldiae]|nr:ulp1 protease family protein [Colletotrichum tofieldiae]
MNVRLSTIIEASEYPSGISTQTDNPDLLEVPQLSLECLGSAWLKDDVVQASVRLVATSSPDPMVVGESLVTANTNSSRPLRSVVHDLSDASTIVLPLFTSNHWMLAIVRDEGTRRFEAELYDSLRSAAHLQHAQQCLDAFQRVYFPASEPDPVYLTSVSCPQQTNDTDCGVMTIAFQVYLVAGYPMPTEMDTSLWRLLVCIMNRLYTCAATVSSDPVAIVDELRGLFREHFINCEQLLKPPILPEVLPPPVYHFSTSSAYRVEDTIKHTDNILRWQREVSEFAKQQAKERVPAWSRTLQHVVHTCKLFTKLKNLSIPVSVRLASKHQQQKSEVGMYAHAAEASDDRVRDDAAQASRRLRRVREQEQRLKSAMVAWDLLIEVLGEAELALRERIAVAQRP